MQVQITNQIRNITTVATYTTYRLSTEKKTCIVTIVTGSRSYVNVTIDNASHRAYRGMGKEFTSLTAAEANYKCPQIKAMIRAIA